MLRSKFLFTGSVALLLATATSSNAQQPAGARAVTLGSFGRVVSNLDTSIAFYRDVLDLDLMAPATAPESDAAIQKVMNTPGARIRSVRFKVPNEPYSIELVEFSGIERKPQLSNHNDPGSSFLNMGYLDSAKILAALRDAHAVPASPLGLPAPGKRGSPWVRDPDGFLFEIMRGGWDDQKKPKEGLRSAYRGHFGITMETIQQSMAFYHDLLGFSIQLGFGATSAASQDNGTPCTSGKGLCVKAGEFRPVGGIADGIGFPGGGNLTASEGYCAGARCEFFEFKDAPRKAFRPRMQDPGAAYLSVWTSDFDGLVSRMKAAGTDVVSTGGAPVLVHGTRQLLVRDPGGFLVLLMEKK